VQRFEPALTQLADPGDAEPANLRDVRPCPIAPFAAPVERAQRLQTMPSAPTMPIYAAIDNVIDASTHPHLILPLQPQVNQTRQIKCNAADLP